MSTGFIPSGASKTRNVCPEAQKYDCVRLVESFRHSKLNQPGCLCGFGCREPFGLSLVAPLLACRTEMVVQEAAGRR